MHNYVQITLEYPLPLVGESTDLGQTDNLSSNTVIVAGVAVSVVVLVLAAVSILVLVVWWR